MIVLFDEGFVKPTAFPGKPVAYLRYTCFRTLKLFKPASFFVNRTAFLIKKGDNMPLTKKYQELLTAARASGVSDLKVREHSGVLYIDVKVPSEDVKEKLWTLYGKISEHRRDDVIMNISVERNGEISNGS